MDEFILGEIIPILERIRGADQGHDECFRNYMNKYAKNQTADSQIGWFIKLLLSSFLKTRRLVQIDAELLCNNHSFSQTAR